uniref:Kinesin motor domain-containing protein n=1 Tax=Anopheles maculatus TaxID=74869 RepID=A0A182T5X4_9DIPT
MSRTPGSNGLQPGTSPRPNNVTLTSRGLASSSNSNNGGIRLPTSVAPSGNVVPYATGTEERLMCCPPPPDESLASAERQHVTVRIRPLSDSSETNCIQAQPNRSCSLLFDDGTRNKPKNYNYDCVFGEASTQEEVYTVAVAPLVQDVLNGYNAAVFAYGATGSGKTHTMLGPHVRPVRVHPGGQHSTQTASAPGETPATPSEALNAADQQPGVAASMVQPSSGLMIRAVADIFDYIDRHSCEEATFRIVCGSTGP